jgi:hypothetical protein
MLIETDEVDRSCCECGEKGDIISLQENEQTGWRGFFMYCGVCFASGYHPDKRIVHGTRLGVTGEIMFIPDDTQCVNCDSYIIAPDALKSDEWEEALEEYRAWEAENAAK